MSKSATTGASSSASLIVSKLLSAAKGESLRDFQWVYDTHEFFQTLRTLIVLINRVEKINPNTRNSLLADENSASLLLCRAGELMNDWPKNVEPFIREHQYLFNQLTMYECPNGLAEYRRVQMPRYNAMVRSREERQKRVSSILDKWYKLTRITGGTRVISLPASLLIEVNCDPRFDLVGRWLVENSRLRLQIDRLDQIKDNERRQKLVRVGNRNTRSTFLGSSILKRLNLDPMKDLVYRWSIEAGNLFLEVKYDPKMLELGERTEKSSTALLSLNPNAL
ncbi:MAG TPA: hypothetical protein VJZ32_03135 [Candidatus Bathyarchaeia archaeon]|nr:hypothetical protein [Candidatus Bathyarchaeia archaeon]